MLVPVIVGGKLVVVEGEVDGVPEVDVVVDGVPEEEADGGQQGRG